MKAPNKIYIGFSDPSLERGFVTGCIEKMKSDDLEYIRKDIVDETIKTAEDHSYFAGQEKFREKLIEWLEYEKEWFEGTDIEPHYQKMIDKLNSIV